MGWEIGEVIKKTGLTARALHFYEEQGLIGRISRTDAGHRPYTQANLIRLQQIRSMRLLGVQISDMPPLLHDDVSKLKNQLMTPSFIDFPAVVLVAGYFGHLAGYEQLGWVKTNGQ